MKVKKKLNIKIVGCGGVGLCVLHVLPRYLAYCKDFESELTLIDGDEYQDNNRTRQAFTRHGNKAEVTAEKIRAEFGSHLPCWVNGEYVTEENVLMFFREGDILFSCVDNHATRKLLSDRHQELENAVLISGGNEYEDGNVQIAVREDGKNLTQPIANKYHPEIQTPADKNPGNQRSHTGGCGVEQVSQPQLLITNNAVAASMLNAFYAYTKGVFNKKDKKYDEAYTDILLNKVSPRVRV